MPGERAGLLAGAARVDVTPPVGIELFGYHRPEPMVGVLDPLYATALVVAADGEPPVVLLAVDHIGLGVADTDAVRLAVADAVGTEVARTAVCYSHTHAGPDCEDLDWHGRARPADGVERRYRAELLRRCVAAARAAAQASTPARAAVGTAESTGGVNRRVRGADGRAAPGVNPDGPVDRTVTALRLDGADGRPLAAVVHYGVHGTALKGDDLRCSADAAGAVRAVVEAATGAPCLFVQGAAGDVDPRWRGGDDALRRLGWEIGGAALRALAAAEPAAEPRVGGASESIAVRLGRLPDEAAARALATTVADRWEAPTTAWLDAVLARLAAGERDLTLRFEVQALRVGDFVRAGVPMEPFAGLGLAFGARTADLAGASGVPPCFGGYTNGLVAYLPTAEEHAAGGYEVEWMPVVYGPYAGLLTPPVAEAGDDVVAAAVRVAARLCERGA